MRTAVASLIVFAVIGCGQTPAEDKKAPDTAKWTHTELVEHLKAKGLKFETKRASGTGTNPSMGMVFAEDNVVYAELFPTDQAAKEFSAATPKEMFSWGRFVFYSKNSGSLATVKKVTAGQSAQR